MNNVFDISIGESRTADDQPGLLAKLSCQSSELNVWFTVVEAAHLVGYWDAHALSGRTLGESAGLPILWSLDDEDHVYLLLGGDNTTWDVGFTLSVENATVLVDEVRAFISLSSVRQQP